MTKIQKQYIMIMVFDGKNASRWDDVGQSATLLAASAGQQHGEQQRKMKRDIL